MAHELILHLLEYGYEQGISLHFEPDDFRHGHHCGSRLRTWLAEKIVVGKRAKYLRAHKADELHDAAHEVLILARVRHVEGVKELLQKRREETPDISDSKSGLAILLQDPTHHKVSNNACPTTMYALDWTSAQAARPDK